MKVVSVAGGPPDLVQLAPVDRALAQRSGVEHTIVAIGPGGDRADAWSAVADDLGIPAARHRVTVDGASLAAVTAALVARLEPILAAARPDLVLVYGAAEATLAAALVAAQLGLPVGHVEAGLRTASRSSVEQLNRAVADRLADLLFAPSRDAVDNLRREGIDEHRVHFVGNVIVDALAWALPRARQRDAARRHGVAGAPYVVAALGARPRELAEPLEALADDVPVVWVEPLEPLDLLGLVADAALVVTDGDAALQEATSYLGVPCVTVGSGVERPITCVHGTNRLVAPQREAILAAARRALQRRSPARPLIERWDGRAAERIAAVVCDGAHFPADGEPDVATPPRAERRSIAIPQPASVL